MKAQQKSKSRRAIPRVNRSAKVGRADTSDELVLGYLSMAYSSLAQAAHHLLLVDHCVELACKHLGIDIRLVQRTGERNANGPVVQKRRQKKRPQRR